MRFLFPFGHGVWGLDAAVVSDGSFWMYEYGVHDGRIRESESTASVSTGMGYIRYIYRWEDGRGVAWCDVCTNSFSDA